MIAAALHDDSAELAVLGAVAIRNSVLDDIADVLSPEHFRRAHFRTVFAAMLALHRKGDPIDPLTIAGMIERDGVLDADTKAFLWTLGNGVPHSGNVGAYARTVRDKALLRALRQEGAAMVSDSEDGELSGAELLERSEQSLYRLGASEVQSDWVSGEALAAELYPIIEELTNNGRAITGVETGISDLDRMTRGFQNGDLVLVGARPGSGKTSLGQQIAMHAAQHTPVAFFTTEMARQPLGLRGITADAQVDGFRMMSGYLSNVELQRVSDGLGRLAQSKIWFDDTPQLSPLQVRSKLRRLGAKAGKVGLVVIDYLQLMASLPEDRKENKTNQVAGISRALKLLAREFNVPFVVLAQLNRALERGADKRPGLSDLRDSGALEQDADVVVLIHRPEMYDRDKPELSGVAELIVAKQRNGPTGILRMHFEKTQMRFRSAQ